MDKITIGRVVYYTLTPEDVKRITTRRTNNSCAEGNPVVAGQQVAMEVTAVNVSDDTVNGQCTLDGNDAHWVGHVPQRFVGDHAWGRWFWPKIERPDHKSDNPNPQYKAHDAATPQQPAAGRSALPAPSDVLPLHNRKSEETTTAAPKSDKAEDTIVIPRTAEEELEGAGGFTFPPGEGPQPGDSTSGAIHVPSGPVTSLPVIGGPAVPATAPAPPSGERPKTRAEKKADKAATKAAEKAAKKAKK